MAHDELEFSFGDRDLGHVECKPELIFGDVTMSQLIEILHELSNSDSFFLNFSSDPSQQIFQVLRNVISDVGFVGSWLLLKVNEALSIRFRNELSIFVVFINILNELVVIDFAEVTSVHVLFKQKIELQVILWNKIKLFQDSGKLVFRHVTDFRYVKIFEQWFQMSPFI
jgi:hypothetical protein